jgi:predicted enzyme related to lactoylglutathione lyase
MTGEVVGIGGVFLRSPDPAALSAWYARVLGVKLERWGGAIFPHRPDGKTVFSLFAADSDHFAPSTREAMINFVVDDLDAVVARVEAEGVALLGREDADTYGRFAWILDPDGTKVELWEAKRP